MKRCLVSALSGVIIAVVVASCASNGSGSSSSSSGNGKMTYDQIVRQIGRPPNRTVSAPDGGRRSTWETEVRGGVRHLIVTFDADGRMTGSTTETRPRQVRRR